MKKFFEQPALEVVRMKNNDIVTLSIGEEYSGEATLSSGRRFDDWYEGY